MTYQKTLAKLNGHLIDAIAVGSVTYLIWTAAKLTGANITKVKFGDVEIDGKKGPQVVQGGNTYLAWDSIPTIDKHPTKNANGVWEFTSGTPHVPVEHKYSLVVIEQDTQVAGQWAQIVIKTLDNGQPLGHQSITISENGKEVAQDFTGDNGEYGWGIIETTDKTDTMTVTWKDPAGVTHTTTHSTRFEVPETTDAPIPNGDNVVVRIPILPFSDSWDAVFFDLLAPDGKTVIETQLDTGAFELMFTADNAKALGLKSEGTLTVQGVGGTDTAYESHATFSINGVQFRNIPCVVSSGYKGRPLFGYKYFIDNGYDLLVSHKHHQIVILKAAA